MVFVSFGILAGIVPGILHSSKRFLSIIGGAIIIFFGLHLSGIFRVFALEKEYKLEYYRKPSGYLGTFLIGIGFAAGWTPCIGPILASILALAAGTSGGLTESGIMLFFYSIGIGIPFFLSSIAIGYFLGFFSQFKKIMTYLSIISGLLLIITGILLVTDSWRVINVWLLGLFPENYVEGRIAGRLGISYLVALLGGLLSFLSPCILPLVPSYVTYITGISLEELTESNKR